MSVKIRLQRHGRKQAPFYHIVIADSRAPRDGKFIERIGTYNPMTIPATIELDNEKAFDWLSKGAQPTDTVNGILKYKGVLFQKHLARGVKKGALTTEQAAEKLTAFVDARNKHIVSKVEETIKAKQEFQTKVFGIPKAVKPVAQPEPEPVEEVVAHIEETPAVAHVEEVVAHVEETPVVAHVEETPAAE